MRIARRNEKHFVSEAIGEEVRNSELLRVLSHRFWQGALQTNAMNRTFFYSVKHPL
jgi:hypothetical protein